MTYDCIDEEDNSSDEPVAACPKVAEMISPKRVVKPADLRRAGTRMGSSSFGGSSLGKIGVFNAAARLT